VYDRLTPRLAEALRRKGWDTVNERLTSRLTELETYCGAAVEYVIEALISFEPEEDSGAAVE